MWNNSLCQGVVWHKRYTPKIHQFSYKLNMWLIALNQAEFHSDSRVVSCVKWAIYRFNSKNYLRHNTSNISLVNKVYQQVTELGGVLNGDEQVFLLGQMSNLGIYFSPLNLYLVVKDEECRYILAEVSNTPWNERYYYLLDRSQTKIISEKKFHVSPFFNLDQEYHWSFKLDENKLHFSIDTFDNNEKVFSAGYHCNLIEFKSTGFMASVLKSPLNVYKIITGIYFEALRIFLKKIPFVAHPRVKN